MLQLSPLESSIFDTIGGLPVHPLIDHAVIMLIPISAIALIVIFFVPKWRKPYGWLTMAALAGGAFAAIIAKESGEALAARVGLPAEHQQLANILVPVMLATFVVGAVWFWLQRRAALAGVKSLAATIVGAAASLLSVAALVLVVLVGHTGATAVWASQISGSDTPTPTPTSTTSAAGITMAQVQQHASATSCWTAVDGKVYDVTNWINQHPGGPQRIISLCGTDGTAAFHGQHATQSLPNKTLAGFEIGTLTAGAASSTIPSAPASSAGPTVYSMADVQQHASAASCWSAIDGNVYDLTKWVNRHPGGAARILSLCGVDGTARFHGEHHKESTPNKTLAGFQIGKLG